MRALPHESPRSLGPQWVTRPDRELSPQIAAGIWSPAGTDFVLKVRMLLGAKLAQKLGQRPSFIVRCIPAGMHGLTGIFWANLTPFSLKCVDMLDVKAAGFHALPGSCSFEAGDCPRAPPRGGRFICALVVFSTVHQCM